jgi:hypothetical protein
MFQFAVFMTCQIPEKSGFPSAARGTAPACADRPAWPAVPTEAPNTMAATPAAPIAAATATFH